MNTAPTHPFDLKLARNYSWPLVTRGGVPVEVLKWDARGPHPIKGVLIMSNSDDERSWFDTGGWSSGRPVHHDDLLLSADYGDQAVRDAVHRAWRGGEALKYGSEGYRWTDVLACGFYEPQPTAFGNWEDGEYRLAQHAPKPKTLPPLPAGHQWHNPAGVTLTQLQVEDGWRFLTDQEQKTRSLPRDPSRQNRVDRWSARRWNDGFSGDDCRCTYRTKLPLPEPIVAKPWSFTDVPMGAVIRPGEAALRLELVAVDRLGVTITHGGSSRHVNWDELSRLWKYSLDGSTWHPCTK